MSPKSALAVVSRDPASRDVASQTFFSPDLAEPLADDVLALGAAAMPSESLVRLLLARDASDDEVGHVVRALSLSPRARLEVLRGLSCGPRLLAALELGRRAVLSGAFGAPRVRGPADLAALALPRCAGDEEQLVGFALDEQLVVARMFEVARGRGDRLSVRPADVLGPALAAGCRLVALAHRHGSGTPTPSDEDLTSALRLASVARELGMCVIDHVLLGDAGHVSFLRRGVLPRVHHGYS